MDEFFDAVEDGDTQLVRTLLEADPSLVNATDTRMTEPLDQSTKRRVRKEGRPKPALRPRKRASLNSALHIAVDNRHFEVARMLIERGANVNAGGDLGTPLERAMYGLDGPVSVELVRMLIENGADANAGKPGSSTVLHSAISAMLVTPPPRKELVEILVRAGVDVTARTRSGVTALERLFQLPKCSERVPIAKMLIDEERRRGRPTEAPLLCLAGSRDEPEVVRFLIGAGMDVNRADEKGNRPLHHAARGGFSENVRLLLAAGADPWALDAAGRTAIECIPQKLLAALTILEEYVKRRAR